MRGAQLGWFIGLVASIATAVVGQAELVGEPWRHWLALIGVIGTAVTGYMMQHPPPAWDGTERRAPSTSVTITTRKES